MTNAAALIGRSYYSYPTLAEAYNVAAQDGLRKIVTMKLPVFSDGDSSDK